MSQNRCWRSHVKFGKTIEKPLFFAVNLRKYMQWWWSSGSKTIKSNGAPEKNHYHPIVFKNYHRWSFFGTNASGTTCWTNMQQMQIVLNGGHLCKQCKWIYLRVFNKACFWRKNWLNSLCKYLGVALIESKRILDFDKFLGVNKSFLFWPFLHCRFSLSPHSEWQSEGCVRICYVKQVKTKMTCALPKTYKNLKSFLIPSKQPPNTCRAGWANFFSSSKTP